MVTASWGADEGPAGEQFEEEQLWRQRFSVIEDTAKARSGVLDAAIKALEGELLTRDQLALLPTADPLIPGVLNRVTYALLTGRDATYKTMFALGMSCSLATGTPWFKRPVDPVRVLYLIGEGAYDFDRRISAWEEAAGVPVRRDQLVTLPRVPNLFKAHDLPALLAVIERGGYGLVVVDTLRRAATGADMNGSDMARVIDSLEEIKRATGDGAVLVLAHTDKGDTDARGFSAIEDDADTVWHCKREKNSPVVEIRNEKMRGGPDGATFTMTPRPVSPSIVLDLVAESGNESRSLAERGSPTARKILDVLTRDGYQNGASGPDLQVTAALSKQRISDGLRELIESGLVARTGARGEYWYQLSPAQTRTRASP